MKTIIYILLFLVGCKSIQKNNEEKKVVFRWTPKTGSFRDFVSKLGISTKDKDLLISSQYNTYGKVIITNNLKRDISFMTFQNICDVGQVNFHEGMAHFETHEHIHALLRKYHTRFKLTSGESTELYLIFKTHIKINPMHASVTSPIDSIENTFRYRIGGSKNHLNDSLAITSIFLKKNQNKGFVMTAGNTKYYSPDLFR